MRAAIYVDEGRIEAREIGVPSAGERDVLLKVRACGLCGTDIRKVRHHLITPPTVLGHEVAGVVFSVGSEVTKFRAGDRVVVAHHTPCYVCHYCLHKNYSQCHRFKESNLDPGGFAEYLRIPSSHVDHTAFKIPHGMTDDQAIFMEPLACVLRNLKRTTLLDGDTVLVTGLGPMGILTGQAVRNSGCRVAATDLREDRMDLARRLGFESVIHASDPELKKKLLRMTEGRGADLVVLTAGNAQTYADALQWVRNGGTINIFASLGPGPRLAYEVEELYHREITVFSSYSSSPSELAEALEEIRTGRINVDCLHPKPFGLDEVPSAIESVASLSILKAVIRPGGATS
ncbi:MAG: alcohol dehydrogenase catalytic domain-containing protein [Pseudomonadota bacterium]